MKDSDDFGVFQFRLGKSERDRQLSRELQCYADSAGRASELIKGLLGAYFNGSLDKYNLPGEQPATEAIDERVRAAKAKLLGIKFTDLE